MSGETVRVVVRCRPANDRERSLKCKTVVHMDPSRATCSVTNPSDPSAPKQFTFDSVYFTDSTAEQVYNDVVFPLVENNLEGYNGTVFAYGQTGSGKTFTMQGVNEPPAQRGIIPRAFQHVFEAISTTENVKFLVHSSFIEIYNEEVRDLLGSSATSKLDIKEHPEKGVYVAGLSMHAVHNVAECETLMQRGWNQRHTAATLMNAQSSRVRDCSRSHSIFTVHMEMMSPDRKGDQHIRTAKLHLVDLAGSERQSKTGATGSTFKEATKINLSLSALGNVISALVDGKAKYIPYRDSKLTRLLQDSLGGNTKTIMIACISPASDNYDETISTLRYANRAKNIKNKPRINEDPKDTLLRQYAEEVQRLKELLAQGGGAPTLSQTQLQQGPSEAEIEAERERLRLEYEERMEHMRQQYAAEQQTKAQLANDLTAMKHEYEQSKRALEEQAAQLEQFRHNQTAAVGGDGSAPRLPTSPAAGRVPDAPASQLDPGEAMKRLELLQHQMVGGEQADNTALKEKRQRQKQRAEQRMRTLATALSRVNADDPLLHVYNSTQDKLDAVTKQLTTERKTVRALEQDIRDLQSEFEQDREDYLETIRRQEQQIKLLQAVCDKVQPLIRRDCNYANMERVKKDAHWDEDAQRWLLPEVTINQTKMGAGSGWF